MSKKTGLGRSWQLYCCLYKPVPCTSQVKRVWLPETRAVRADAHSVTSWVETVRRLFGGWTSPSQETQAAKHCYAKPRGT